VTNPWNKKSEGETSAHFSADNFFSTCQNVGN
jgi:hypothetical protein